jgi:hypothetical protein
MASVGTIVTAAVAWLVVIAAATRSARKTVVNIVATAKTCPGPVIITAACRAMMKAVANLRATIAAATTEMGATAPTATAATATTTGVAVVTP